MEMAARIFNIQKFSIYDGPGIRTLVFFKGCPLRCLWCANPEGKSRNSCTLWNRDLCTHCGLCAAVCTNGIHSIKDGQHVINPEHCMACGKCAAICPQRALRLCGQEMETSEIMKIILEDEVFYKTSGGGVTLGGGEPLAQPDAALELLRTCKEAGLHTAMETSGYTERSVLSDIAAYTDLFLYDLKHTDSARHKELTGVENGKILSNLAWLIENDHKVRVRMPLITGCNTELDEIARRAEILRKWTDSEVLLGVDLLPYHKLGVHKYAQMNEKYLLGEDAAVSDEFLENAMKIFSQHSIPAAIIRH